MKSFITLFLILLCSAAQAFTLNNNFGASFKKSKVKVVIPSDTTCTQGITIYELEALIKPAVDNFWNTVPTSRLRLNAAGFSSPVASNINTARLCAPTDAACVSEANADGDEVIPPVTNILIACNQNGKNFGGPNVLAVTVPNNFSGKKIKGAVILINDTSTSFRNLSESDKISVIAHEIGHAIGLGHAEDKNNEALMYYRTVDQRKKLSQDDMDGVSYLYPIKMDACGLFDGIASTIDTDSNSGGGSSGPSPFWQMGISLGLLILISEIKKLLRSPKARAA